MYSVLPTAFLTCTCSFNFPLPSFRHWPKTRSLQVLSVFIFQDIPSDGINKWFKLEGRSSKSRVDGDCHLKITLTAGKVILRDRGFNHFCSGFALLSFVVCLISYQIKVIAKPVETSRLVPAVG